MTASFLRYLQIDSEILDEFLAENYPPILVLMNINGSVLLRTKYKIEMDENDEVEMFHHK